MTYKSKYVKQMSLEERPKSMPGIRPNPEIWGNETSIIEHDRRYAWMKHRAQAKHRKEFYELSIDDWIELWPIEKFINRGRKPENYTMYMIDKSKGWTKDNVIVGLKQEYLNRAKEYRKNNATLDNKEG